MCCVKLLVDLKMKLVSKTDKTLVRLYLLSENGTDFYPEKLRSTFLILNSANLGILENLNQRLCTKHRSYSMIKVLHKNRFNSRSSLY